MPEEKRRQTLQRLRELSDRDLADELRRQRERLFNLRRDNVSRHLENTAAIPQTKKQIARILTLLDERAAVAQGE
jgi:large subunit ribosomal protein L29